MAGVCRAHNVFSLSKGVVARSDFDAGNLANIVETGDFEYDIWTAPDNMGTAYEAKVQPYFYFALTGLPLGTNHLKFRICNPGIHQHSLYKQDMRPVYKSSSTAHRWIRLKRNVRILNTEEEKCVFFEHVSAPNESELSFAFTYPYSYDTLQRDLEAYEAQYISRSSSNEPGLRASIYFLRETLAYSPEGRRIDLITISSNTGRSSDCEPSIPLLFPERTGRRVCAAFPSKEVLFISARVHPGEVPASHTMKGMLDFLLDPDDLRAIELRNRYVLKIIPMLNPDGVYRGRRSLHINTKSDLTSKRAFPLRPIRQQSQQILYEPQRDGASGNIRCSADSERLR